MSTEKKVSCLKCGSLWVGLVIGAIAVIFIGLAIFYQQFYVENFYFLQDIIRFGILSALLLFTIFVSHSCLKAFCSGNNSDFLFTNENLVGGIIASIISIAIIMVIVYYLPMAYQEANLRLLYLISDGNTDKMIQKIYELDCKTFQAGFDQNTWGGLNSSFMLKYHSNQNFAYGGDLIKKKIGECKL